MTVAAILVAGGRGTRMGETLPKQYLDLAGQSILARSIGLFLDHPDIDQVQVVIASRDQSLYSTATEAINHPKLRPATFGGASRSASVLNGLKALYDDQPNRVLIHDAARPLCPQEVISSVIRALDDADGAFAALPVVDALWSSENGHATTSVPRDGLVRAQTPQGFRYDQILEAYEAVHDGGIEAADDVAIARAAGMQVRIVDGDEKNFKITSPSDLARAKRHLEGTANDPA